MTTCSRKHLIIQTMPMRVEALKAMLNPPFLDMMSNNFLFVPRFVLGRRSGNESCVETNYFNPDECPCTACSQQPFCIRCTAATECGPVTIVLERLFQQQTYFILEKFGGTCTSMVMSIVPGTQPGIML